MLSIKNRWRIFWIFCATALFFVYSPTFTGPYILDDTHTLSSNAFIQNLSGFSSIWSTGRAYSSLPANYGYRPFTTTMNMFLWWVGDGSPVPFHLVKIFLFFLTCWLVSRIWRALMPWISPEVIAAGVILFALNPVHTQVVSYIAAIATQWAALFICAAVLSYLEFRKTQSRAWLLASLLGALLAILSKEEGVVVLGLIPLTELYLRKREGSALFSRKGLGSLFLYLVPGILGVGLIVYMFEPTQNMVRADVTTWPYFFTQWRAYLRYFAMYFYSYDLNGDNLQFGFSWQLINKEVLIALVGNLAFIGAALFFWRKQPLFAFALFWFYIGISPASSVVVLSEPVNDHRAFIGYLGFAISGILLLDWIQSCSRVLFVGVVSLGVCAYALMTYQRGDVWQSTEKFWTDTVAKNPSSARAYNNLGLEMLRQGRYESSLQLLQHCTQLQPTYSSCYINRAVAFSQTGRDPQAELEFQMAVQFDRGVIQSRYNWAKFLSARGQFTKAQELLKEADQVAQGQNLDVRLELIDIVRQQGNVILAKKLLVETLSTFGRQPKIMSEAVRLGLDY